MALGERACFFGSAHVAATVQTVPEDQKEQPMTIPIPERLWANGMWRYMAFDRFVWTLREKALWLSRADLLGDLWEARPSEAQIDADIAAAEADRVRGEAPYATAKEVVEGHLRFFNAIPRVVYVNCWTCRKHESHLMWRSYCGASEGVAIRTTLGKLRASLPDHLEVLPVSYTLGLEAPVGLLQRATLKRPMFEDEREWRVIWANTDWLATADENPPGRTVLWDPSAHLDAVFVHPESEESFLDKVFRAVREFAPDLTAVVERSPMALDPRMAYLPAFRRLEDGSK